MASQDMAPAVGVTNIIIMNIRPIPYHIASIQSEELIIFLRISVRKIQKYNLTKIASFKEKHTFYRIFNKLQILPQIFTDEHCVFTVKIIRNQTSSKDSDYCPRRGEMQKGGGGVMSGDYNSSLMRTYFSADLQDTHSREKLISLDTYYTHCTPSTVANWGVTSSTAPCSIPPW